MRKHKLSLSGRAAKVPVIMQMEELECGAACLAMILAYYGKWIPLAQARVDCAVGRDGTNALNIIKAARNYGMTAKGYSYDPKMLRQKGVFPCIVHWNFNHFVVLNGFKGDKVYINDPARGHTVVSMKEFDEAFTGVCIFMSPSEKFQPAGKPPSVFGFAYCRLKGAEASLIFVALTAFITSLISFINPGFQRVFLDYLINNQNSGWFSPFIWLLVGFDVIQIVSSGLNDIYLLRIDGKMAVTGNTSFVWKLLKMPIEFFSQRMAGDIQQRQQSNSRVVSTLIHLLAPLLLQVIMMILYLCIMLKYSWILSLFGIICMTVSVIVSRIVSQKRISIARTASRDGGKLASVTISGIDMIETIKSSGAEDGFFSRWAGHFANVNTQQVRSQKTAQTLGVIPEFLASLAQDLVLVMGVFLIMQGELTVGLVMAFQSFLFSFMQPVQTLTAAGQTILEMRTDMERIDDIMTYPDDNAFAPDSQVIAAPEKLKGHIEMKNVSFGYSKLDEPLIKNFSMSLTPGKSIAFVGGSGCGKSTLSKLIAGLYRPWNGEILYDGKPLDQIPKSIFSASLSVVDQDVVLFEDSVSNNIKMWNAGISDQAAVLAAIDAQIHEEIMSRPGAYNRRLLENAKDLSGGQRQRLEIARALSSDPNILLLDEATSALDAKTEFEVMESIRSRHIAIIVIAHRLSTIRSCDEIIVLDNGEIVGRGTHEQLLSSCEKYRALVAAY